MESSFNRFNKFALGKGRAFPPGMSLPAFFAVAVIFFTAPLFVTPLSAGQAFLRAAAETNVNQRYLVESVSLAGVEVAKLADAALPFPLRSRLFGLVGQRCDTAILEDLSTEIRKQLHFRAVTQHLSRGSEPDRIRVDFAVVQRDLAFEISLPRFLYHSRQGFSGELEASTRARGNSLMFGAVSNGDDLTERFSGMKARFDSAGLGSDNLRLHIAFEDYHQQWASETLQAAAQTDSGMMYRARWNVAPSLTYTPARSVTLAVGTSFQRMESATPGTATLMANAATFGAHFGHMIEGEVVQQQIEGKYDLRLVSRMLGSTYAYARHLISLRYEVKSGRHRAAEEFTGGSIAGNAPLFDRFVLGTSSSLRGWDRYEIDPLGGSRVVHNELSYSYRIGDRTGDKTVEAFYDSGALWQTDRAAKLRHSVGVSYRQGVFVMTMAFPLRDGRVEPVVMAGMNY